MSRCKWGHDQRCTLTAGALYLSICCPPRERSALASPYTVITCARGCNLRCINVSLKCSHTWRVRWDVGRVWRREPGSIRHVCLHVFHRRAPSRCKWGIQGTIKNLPPVQRSRWADRADSNSCGCECSFPSTLLSPLSVRLHGAAKDHYGAIHRIIPEGCHIIAPRESSALGLQHAIVRAFFRDHFNASCNTCSRYLSLSLALHLISLLSNIFSVAFPTPSSSPIHSVPLPPPVLPYFLRSPLRAKSCLAHLPSPPPPLSPPPHHPGHLISSRLLSLYPPNSF